MIKHKRLIRYHTNKYNIRMYNFRLVLWVVILSTIGILAINSAADGFSTKQMLGCFIGIFAMAFLSLIDYNYIAKFEWPLYCLNVIVLVGVKLFGINVNGATRWFSLGPFGTLQPSEFSKIAMIVIFAKIISDRRDTLNQFPELLKIMVLYGIPCGLVMIETDLSTTLVLAFIFCVLIFIGGLSYKIVSTVLLVSAPTALGLAWYIQQPFQILLKDYQLDRVLSFLRPEDYMLTTYHQQYNSQMAIGSGMLLGKGLNNNTFTSVKGGNFISEPQTDFIFAVVGEELGFIGACIVIILLGLIIFECLMIAKDARNMSGRLIACGVAAIFAFQSFVNIGVATGILPNTGLPLPFVSYGLSSLLSCFFGIGLVLNVGLQRNRR